MATATKAITHSMTSCGRVLLPEESPVGVGVDEDEKLNMFPFVFVLEGELEPELVEDVGVGELDDPTWPDEDACLATTSQ